MDDTQGGSREQDCWIRDPQVLLQTFSVFEVCDVLIEIDRERARELIADCLHGITNFPSLGAGRNVAVSSGSSSSALDECFEDYVAYLTK